MNILIIDDHPIVKEGVEMRIKKVLPDAACYFASTPRMAIAKTRDVLIDIIFCDLEFDNDPTMDGFKIVKSIKKFEPNIKFIALTTYNSYKVMKKALDSGFHCFLEKGCSFNEFKNSLLNVIAFGTHTSDTMKKLKCKRRQFLETLFAESLHGVYGLSEREKELTLLTAKTTDRNILSKKMNISPFTVDTYFKKILTKLNLKHRQELALFSLEFKDELMKSNG